MQENAGIIGPHVVIATGERSRIRRQDRSVPEEAYRILAQGVVAHVAFVQDEQPYVIPFSYHYDPAQPEHLYLHGSATTRTLLHMGSGNAVSICVTLLDGLVYSRTAMNHSMNYHSVVCFGKAHSVESEQEKRVVFEAMIARYFEGRTAGRDYAAATPEQLNATTMVRVEIEEMSAKARAGGPIGPLDADLEAMGTAGVLELPPLKCPFSGRPSTPKR